jgi:phospholipid-binding lipoprotein MlaA
MRSALAAALAALLLAGCATAPQPGPRLGGAAQADADRDPFEPMNRALFGLGRGLDKAVARPLAVTYRRVLPKPVRRGLHNALQNADEPGVAVNDLLQGRIGTGARTAVRFAANTLFGLAGLFDPAAKAGIPHHDNGFAATLGRYGAPPGPYLYVPLLGPSSVRDAIGGGVDYLSDPLSLPRYQGAKTVNIARTGLSLVDTRARADHEIESLFATATDPYATARSVYLQYEASDGGEAQPPLEDLPDFPAAAPDTSTPDVGARAP